jgi:hypothetical protein
MNFAALVIGKDIRGQLAPFMRNSCNEPEKRYMVFYDQEDALLHWYENGSQERIVMPDGRLVIPWDDDDPFPPHPAPEHLEKRVIVFKETYATFEDFAREWCGYKERDEIYNRYGIWQNPNGKWDWFMIGGNWTGFFKLKEGRKGVLGKPGVFRKEITDESWADQAHKDDIDFDQMRNEAEKRAIKNYDAVQEAIRDTPPNESLELMTALYVKDRKQIELALRFLDEISYTPSTEWFGLVTTHYRWGRTQLEEALKMYEDQPRVKKFREFAMSEKGRKMDFFGSVDDFNIPREQYVQNARNGAVATLAVVKDGKWHERGEKDRETWHSIFSELLNELQGDELLTVVDCDR